MQSIEHFLINNSNNNNKNIYLVEILVNILSIIFEMQHVCVLKCRDSYFRCFL